MQKTFARLIPDEVLEDALYNFLKSNELKNAPLQQKIEATLKWCREAPKNVVLVQRLLKGNMLQPGIISFHMGRYLHIDWLKCSLNSEQFPAQTQVELVEEHRFLIPDETFLEHPSSFFSKTMWECGYFFLDCDCQLKMIEENEDVRFASEEVHQKENTLEPLPPAMDVPLAVTLRTDDQEETQKPTLVSDDLPQTENILEPLQSAMDVPLAVTLGTLDHEETRKPSLASDDLHQTENILEPLSPAMDVPLPVTLRTIDHGKPQKRSLMLDDLHQQENILEPLSPAMDVPLAVKLRTIDHEETQKPSLVSDDLHKSPSIFGSTKMRAIPSLASCHSSTASLLDKHSPTSKIGRRFSVQKLHAFSMASLKEASNNRRSRPSLHQLDLTVIAALKVRIHRARKKRMARRRFIIRPFTVPKMMYDALMASLVCYSVITVPVQLAFGALNAGGYKAFNLFTDALFMLDIAICFDTAYEEGGQLVYDRKLITKNYLKTLFFPDLLGSFPFYILSEAIGISSNLFIFKLLRLLRAMRLMRFTLVSKFSRITRFIKKLKASGFDLPFQSDSTFINLITRTIKILFIAHLMACTWHSLNSCKHESYDWVRCGNDTNLASQYLAAFYFTIQTMMTVGYGDVAVNTDAQRAFAMVIQLSGPLIVGVIVSSIGELVDSFDLRSKYMTERMSSLKEYMNEKNLPGYVCRKLVKHFNYFYSRTTVFKEGVIIESLPSPVLDKLVLHQHKSSVENIVFFNVLFCGNAEFVLTVFRLLKPMFTQAGQDIAIQGDPAEDIYFLKRGQVDGLLMGSGLGPIMVGVFGQGSTVNMANVVLRLEMPFNLRAACQSDILWIHMQDWTAAMAKHPKMDSTIMDMVQKEREYATTVLQSNTIVLGNRNTKEIIFCEPNTGNVQKLWNAKDVELKVESLKNLQSDAGHSRRTIRTIRLSKSMLRWASGFDLMNRKRISPENLSQFDHDVIEKEETTKSLWGQYLIDPQCDSQKYWGVWIMLLTLYSVIIIPFSIGFEFNTPILDTLDGVVDGFFLLDIMMKFRTLDEAGPELYFADPIVIALRYLRSWFVLDLVSSLPLESISLLGSHNDSKNGQFLRLARVCRFLRFLKLMRLFKFTKLSKTVTTELGPHRYIMHQLIILFGSLLYVGHFFGCFWAFVAYNNHHGLEDSWMAPLPAGPLSLAEADIVNQYTASVYWAFTTITTVGYGDIKPTNDYEKLYSIIIMVIGAALFSFIVGNVSNLAYQLSVLKQVQKKKVSEINEYVKEQRLGYNLSNSIKKHVKFAFSKQTSHIESEILKLLPSELRKDTLLYAHHHAVEIIPLFDDAPRSFVATCLQKMSPQFYEARSTIYTSAEGSKGIYFVIKGVVEELKKHAHAHAKEKLFGIVEIGGYFGHRRYVNGVKVSFGAKAVADSFIFVLLNNDFAQLEIEFPSVAKKIKIWLHNARAGIRQANGGKKTSHGSFDFGKVEINQVAPAPSTGQAVDTCLC